MGLQSVSSQQQIDLQAPHCFRNVRLALQCSSLSSKRCAAATFLLPQHDSVSFGNMEVLLTWMLGWGWWEDARVGCLQCPLTVGTHSPQIGQRPVPQCSPAIIATAGLLLLTLHPQCAKLQYQAYAIMSIKAAESKRHINCCSLPLQM